MNLRPLGYEPNELPNCSIPRYKIFLMITINGKEKKIQQDFLKTLLRCQDTTQGLATGSAVMFPYMAPNNNSIFAANMIESLFSGPRFAIKNCEKVGVSKEGKLEYPPQWLARLLK